MAASLERSPMPKRVGVLGFEQVNYWNPFAFAIPCWFLVPATFAVAVLPWFRLRFRLRTLFITLTLIAVSLGILARLTHN